MRTAELDYDLPGELIARRPPEQRDGARLLVVRGGALEHRRMVDWPELVPEGALVVLNDSRVIPARLFGERRGTGGRIELLLLSRLDVELDPADREQRWEALGKANRPLRAGTCIDAGALQAEVLGRAGDGVLVIELRCEGGVSAALERHGRVPIPPYLEREDDEDDRHRYQTIFAARPGSVAAPTAGLHLSERLMEALSRRGVEIAALTLHVGMGTFRPVSVHDLDDHVMHAERFEITPALAQSIERARSARRPVVAVGTTVVRALEAARDPERSGTVCPGARATKLLIQPGFRFDIVDALLTNFHQPRSTLLALVAAFAGQDRVRRAYQAAVESGYRFLSYGDATWFPERLA